MKKLEEVYNIPEFYQNRNYKMVFEIGEKSKSGKEKFIYNEGDNAKNDLILSNLKDSYLEKRKGKVKSSVIGTTLVNILNELSNLLIIFDMCINKIEMINIQNIKSFYNDVMSIIEQTKILQIKNLFDYHCIIDDYIMKTNSLKNIRDIIEKLKQETDIDGLQKLCGVYKKIFLLKDKYQLGINDDDLNSHILLLVDNNPMDLSSFVSLIYNEMLENSLLFLSKSICDRLKDYSFVLTTFIDNFEYDYRVMKAGSEVYSQNYMNFVDTMALYIEPDNIFYTNLYNHFETSNDFALKDYVLIFVKSFFKELFIIKKNFAENKVGNYIKLPKVDVRFSNETSQKQARPHQYTYIITKFTDFVNISMYHIALDNRKLLECHNCGRYFISDIRNNEVYCTRKDLFDVKQRSCKEIGAEKMRYTSLTEPRRNLYKKIYNRLHNDKKGRYDKDELEIFQEEYKEYKDELYNNGYTKQSLNKALVKWLKKYNDKLMKKYPSNRYGKKKKNNN